MKLLFIDRDGDACLEHSGSPNNLVALPARDLNGELLNPTEWQAMVACYNAFGAFDATLSELSTLLIGSGYWPDPMRHGAPEGSAQDYQDACANILDGVKLLLPRAYDVWVDDPDYPVEDWVYEVDNNDTRRGYWDWVAAMKEGD